MAAEYKAPVIPKRVLKPLTEEESLRQQYTSAKMYAEEAMIEHGFHSEEHNECLKEARVIGEKWHNAFDKARANAPLESADLMIANVSNDTMLASFNRSNEPQHLAMVKQTQSKAYYSTVGKWHQEILNDCPDDQLYQADPYLAALRLRRDEYRALKKEKDDEEDTCNSKDYIYVTWNPDPKSKLDDVVRAFHRLVTKKQNTNYMAVIEHYTEKGEHTHFHILIACTKLSETSLHADHRRQKFTDGCASTFSGYYKHSKETLNIKYIAEANVQGIKNYIEGQKAADKMHLVDKDRVWRGLMSLPQTWKNGSLA